MKNIKFDKSMYELKHIKREVEYFENLGYRLVIDHEFCVYAMEGRKKHWLGYARPISLKWFDAQFDCDQGGNDVRPTKNSRKNKT